VLGWRLVNSYFFYFIDADNSDISLPFFLCQNIELVYLVF